MSRIAWVIFLLFFPAGLSILRPVIWGPDLSHQLLALGLFLFSIDQARMATLDLTQVTTAKTQIQDPRLVRFYWVTLSTIAIELTGFYTAAIALGWGIILVLTSQTWFNLLAGIQLQTSPQIVIQDWGIRARSPILVADIVGLILVGFWMCQIAPLTIVLVLWTMAIIYGCAKLIQSWQRSPQ